MTRTGNDRVLVLILVLLCALWSVLFSESRSQSEPTRPAAHKAVAPTPYTDKELAEWFATYNRRYFSNRLPATTVRWAFLGLKYGETEQLENGQFLIRIDIARNREGIMTLITMLHEMCHVATAGKGFDHGPAWQAEMHRLMLEGAFDELL
jgi:SprT-like family